MVKKSSTGLKEKKFFQISTAIDYPSGNPHLGHMYEKVCADVLARWKRLQGFNVHFSTGTDCHGLKLQRAAEKVGKSPEQYVKEISEIFRELCKVYNISYDDFIMTIEDRHEKTVINILKQLEKSGYIYKGDYEGLYCVDCETFYTEKDLVEGKCPFHPNKEIEKLKEETYFFKLGEFKDKLIKNIKGKDLVWPKKKENEIISRLEDSLKDLSISRANVSWGIPLPFDKSKTIAVWNDALVNYLSTVDYPNKKFKDYWPATHIIGSDIVWHHTAIWYSMLLGIGVKLPNVIVHGFVNMNGEKLSKSKGLKVDPLELAKIYPVDSIRYFLIRNFVFGQDGDFSEKSLIERHNTELANKLGNLVSRVSALAEKYGLTKTENKLLKKLNVKAIEKHFENYEIDKALNEIFAFIDKTNEYVQEKKPWETQDKKVLYELSDSIKAIAILLSPFIPETSEKISEVFNFKIDYKEINKPLKVSKIKKAEILFVKIEASAEVIPKIEKVQLREKTEEKPLGQNKEEKVNKEKIIGVTNMTDLIKYDDFAKLDLRVGTIKSVEDLASADKLWKLSVDLGTEIGQRTILAGIKKYYSKEQLLEKQIIVIVNLEPRKMKGSESQGMLLAAGSAASDTCILISPDSKVENGTKIN